MGHTVTACGMLNHSLQEQFTNFLRCGEVHKQPPEFKEMFSLVLAPLTLCLQKNIRLYAPTAETSRMLFHTPTV